MATDAPTLLSEANCFNCYTATPYALQLMKLSLLAQIVLQGDPMADVTPQALLAQANCFNCYAANPYMLQLMELALLVQVVDNGGGGGGGGLAFSTGTGSPEGVVSGSPGNTYWDTNADTYYVKVTGTGTNTGWAIH